MFEFGLNFSVISEFILVIFIIANIILAYEFKILIIFFDHVDPIGKFIFNYFPKNLGQ